MTVAEVRAASSSTRKLRPWIDRDLIYVRGYVIDRRTGEVLSSVLADIRREVGR